MVQPSKINEQSSSSVLDLNFLKNVHINKPVVDAQIKVILDSNPVTSPTNYKAWLLKAITVIDLTTLAGDDTRSNVFRLCEKAANPLPAKLKEKLKVDDIRTAAVCVYPTRVKEAKEALQLLKLENDINIAAVATGFPSGLYPLSTRVQEIQYAITNGANEIDIVIDRSLVLMGKWDILYEELQAMHRACNMSPLHNAYLKVILGVGELGSYANIYKASMIAMMAGADFIKTSTGKEAVNATLPIGLIMCRAIKKYYQMTNRMVGLKPAGGIKTARDAVNWLVMVYTELGPEWLTPKLFRIGASSLLDEVVKAINAIEDKK